MINAKRRAPNDDRQSDIKAPRINVYNVSRVTTLWINGYVYWGGLR